MIVLDTHAWVWWVAAQEKLSRAARSAIEDADSLGISAMSAWEVARLARRGRIRLDRAPGDWIRLGLAHERVEEIGVSAEHGVAAGLLDDHFPGDPADRIIYATARALRVPLVTRDERIRRYDPEGTLW